MITDKTSKEDRLDSLRREYLAKLKDRLGEIQDTWERLLSGDFEAATGAAKLSSLAHNLAGSAGTFGFKRLGEQARQLELDLHAAASSERPLEADRIRIEGYLADMRSLASLGPSEDSVGSYASPPSFGSSPPMALVYVLEDNLLQGREIALQLENFGYKVVTFSSMAQLAESCRRYRPAAILADISSPEESAEGPRFVSEIRDTFAEIIPVIFFSAQDSWESQLEAVRSGGRAYFPKPLDFTALVAELDRLTGRFPQNPFRILIVEDDDLLANHYASVLQKAGMLAEMVSVPVEIPQRLSAFGPDLIIMDIFLPGCTGIEVAQVIRQNSKFTHLPIVYLSALNSRDEQLLALQVGGDDFLQKPISDAHLVSAIRTRARRFQVLNAMMTRDGLTGLLNHIHMKLTLECELARMQRRKGLLSFAMIDLDHFKTINDRFGHPVGDKVIKMLARLLLERLRKGDYIARYGGEEFAVIMPDTDPQAGCRVLNDLRVRFAAHRQLHGSGEFTTSFSAGIAAAPPHLRMDELIRAADQALYAAKRGGCNRIEMEKLT